MGNCSSRANCSTMKLFTWVSAPLGNESVIQVTELLKSFYTKTEVNSLTLVLVLLQNVASRKVNVT
jgi:hypothetical protein